MENNILKKFLILIGIFLVSVGLLGFYGIIGPNPDDSLFGGFWWFSNTANVIHFIVGMVSIILALFSPLKWQRFLSYIFGFFSIYLGVTSFFKADLFGISLENPTDVLFYLSLGTWALYSVSKKE